MTATPAAITPPMPMPMILATMEAITPIVRATMMKILECPFLMAMTG
jgi:hypothetical protein